MRGETLANGLLGPVQTPHDVVRRPSSSVVAQPCVRLTYDVVRCLNGPLVSPWRSRHQHIIASVPDCLFPVTAAFDHDVVVAIALAYSSGIVPLMSNNHDECHAPEIGVWLCMYVRACTYSFKQETHQEMRHLDFSVYIFILQLYINSCIINK